MVVPTAEVRTDVSTEDLVTKYPTTGAPTADVSTLDAAAKDGSTHVSRNDPAPDDIAENPWKYGMYCHTTVASRPKLSKILTCCFSWLPTILPMGCLRPSMVYHPTL